MKNSRNHGFAVNPQIAFWAICVVVLAWIAATIVFEMRLGLPDTGIRWVKRLAGWGIEGWLIRAFAVRVRRYYQTLGAR